MRQAERRSFSDGPPKWIYSAVVLAVVILHIGLAGFKVGQFAELWDRTWTFYNLALGTTTFGAVAIHMKPRTGGEG